mmetsp:Transcript_60567/g.179528  ORF Transcript_60567/g.179528 Transcript_60567/m.179528 type:complete len:355 (+) Transcript_60567:470-1534(+)
MAGERGAMPEQRASSEGIRGRVRGRVRQRPEGSFVRMADLSSSRYLPPGRFRYPSRRRRARRSDGGFDDVLPRNSLRRMSGRLRLRRRLHRKPPLLRPRIARDCAGMLGGRRVRWRLLLRRLHLQGGGRGGDRRGRCHRRRRRKPAQLGVQGGMQRVQPVRTLSGGLRLRSRLRGGFDLHGQIRERASPRMRRRAPEREHPRKGLLLRSRSRRRSGRARRRRMLRLGQVQRVSGRLQLRSRLPPGPQVPSEVVRRRRQPVHTGMFGEGRHGEGLLRQGERREHGGGSRRCGGGRSSVVLLERGRDHVSPRGDQLVRPIRGELRSMRGGEVASAGLQLKREIRRPRYRRACCGKF